MFYIPALFTFGLTLLNNLIPALLNIIETLINIVYLYLAHIVQWPAAPMIGFGAALMTLSKTILYWAQEYYCGFCAVGHNKVWDLVWLWIVPNGYIASYESFAPFANVYIIGCGLSYPPSLYYSSGRILPSLLTSLLVHLRKYRRKRRNEYKDSDIERGIYCSCSCSL